MQPAQASTSQTAWQCQPHDPKTLASSHHPTLSNPSLASSIVTLCPTSEGVVIRNGSFTPQ